MSVNWLARLIFQRKKSRYCHHSGVVVGVVVVVVTNFYLFYSLKSAETNLMKLRMLVHHHRGYNLTKAYNSAMLIDKITPLYRYT